MHTPKSAMILAAGRGERMRPLTDHIPKPLLEVAGRSLIEWHLERLASAGIQHVVINHVHLGTMIEQRLGTGSRWGLDIVYSPEGQGAALETGGGIANALPLLGESAFLVVNGDVWSDVDFSAMVLAREDLAHLLLVANPDHHPDGDFAMDGARARNTGAACFTYGGIGVYHPAMFEDCPCGPFPLAPLLRRAIDQDRVSACLHKGEWVDVGTPERLYQLRARFT